MFNEAKRQFLESNPIIKSVLEEAKMLVDEDLNEKAEIIEEISA